MARKKAQCESQGGSRNYSGKTVPTARIGHQCDSPPEGTRHVEGLVIAIDHVDCATLFAGLLIQISQQL